MRVSIIPTETELMAGASVTDLVDLIPVLAAAYGVVLGGVALVTGWQWFRDNKPRWTRRGAVVPPVGAIEKDNKRGSR